MCFYKRWFCLRSTSDLDQAWKTTIFTTLSSTKWKETVLSGWMMFHIVSTHINSGLQLMERDPAAVTQHLSADVLADGSRSYRNQLNKLMRMSHCCSVLTWAAFTIQMKQHVGLQQILGAGHLALSRTRTERHPEEKQQLDWSSSNSQLLFPWTYMCVWMYSSCWWR